MRQRRLLVDSTVVSALIDDKFGGVDGMVGHWASEVDRQGEVRERASVYKWLKQGIPAKENTIFGFCGVLDVDPVAIVDYDRLGFFSRFYQIRRAVQMGGMVEGPLRVLLEMYRPDERWPSDWLAQKYFQRSWFRKDFDNLGVFESGTYAEIRVRFAPRRGAAPVCVHIAYRRTSPPEKMWRPYGWVVLSGDSIKLYSESGDFQSSQTVKSDVMNFRTYFGGRAVEFRLACLHDFECEILHPAEDNNAVTFSW